MGRLLEEFTRGKRQPLSFSQTPVSVCRARGAGSDARDPRSVL